MSKSARAKTAQPIQGVRTKMTRPRYRLVWALPALVLLASGCGQTSPTETETTDATTDADGEATVTVTIRPDPATAVRSPDGDFTWSGSFIATVSNTNTTPITINSIAADLQQSSGGIVITPIPDTDEAFRFEVRAPFNRIDINATMDIPFTFFYTLPNLGRESLISIALDVTTDEGVVGTVTASVKMQ